MNVPLTSLIYLIPFASLLVILSVIVSVLRAKNKVEFGSGGVERLEKAIRVQANFCEYVPFAFLVLLCSTLTFVAAFNPASVVLAASIVACS